MSSGKTGQILKAIGWPEPTLCNQYNEKIVTPHLN
jgi:hypothetical protein